MVFKPMRRVMQERVQIQHTCDEIMRSLPNAALVHFNELDSRRKHVFCSQAESVRVRVRSTHSVSPSSAVISAT